MDIESRTDIIELSKHLGLDSQLLLDLIELFGNGTSNLPSIIFNLMKGNSPDQIRICTSLIHTIKGDIAMARPISD